MTHFLYKVNFFLWFKLVRFTRHKKIYLYIYRSFWHFLLNKQKKTGSNINYFGAMPNIGAGIGHQMANWIAGYWYAKLFELNFVHFAFSNTKWEQYLGFGENEITMAELKAKGYKSVKLPLFDELNESEVKQIKAIIRSYNEDNVVFVAEQDQYYKDLYGIIPIIKEKFNNAKSRNKDTLIYDKKNFNIAIHVRRTVIIDSKIILEDEETKAKRWLSNDYYEKVLLNVLENLKINKPIVIHIFSTARANEFIEFSKYGKVVFCNEFDEYKSFSHLIKADLLITSKSSFSYKPALISDGIKVCPKNFWHGYPDKKDWILADNQGDFDVELLKELV